jgi:Xaa-Pro aminopeptidase
MRDEDRAELIRRSLQEHSLDALVCALPRSVLLLSGYWPVVGSSVAIASRDGGVILLAPKDEEDLARRGSAAEVITFEPSTFGAITTAAESIGRPLATVANTLGRTIRRIGFEHGEATEPASYAAMHRYGGTIQALLQNAFASGILVPADELISQLSSIKTRAEISRIRTACELAERAFRTGAGQLRAGITELEAAAGFRAPLSTALADFPEIERADGFVFCMSGSNSALASGAYARSRPRRLESGDLVLVHCNSYADGYWTDITRTYCLGALGDRLSVMYAAVFAARAAAMRSIVAGARADDIDRAARDVLGAHGFGPEFKHGAGHGVGFGAISGSAKPRLHPKSPDTIQPGMVFNLEPAIYIDGYGGIRHCDMMAVTDGGVELLTPFQCAAGDLVIDAN